MPPASRLDLALARGLLRAAAGLPLPPGTSGPALLAALAAPEGEPFRPLVAPALHALGGLAALEGLDPAPRARLDAALTRALRRDLGAARRLRVDLLPAWPADLPLLVLKGLAHDRLLYGAAGPRAGGDLDLLVRAADLPRAGALLATWGARLRHDADRVASRRTGYEQVWVLPGAPPLDIDLHGAVAEPRLFPVAEAALWARARALPSPLGRLRALGAEDALVFTAVHACTHAQRGPVALVDAARLVGQGVDWQALPTVAGQWGARALTGLLLDALARHLDVVVPASVAARLAPGALRAGLDRHLFEPPLAPARTHGARHRLRQALALALLDQRLVAPGFAWRYLRVRARDAWEARRGAAGTQGHSARGPNRLE